ncbi:MAG: hypothetical protein M0P97_00235 [Candidatus Moranbacteria bacterium]|jgi:hypothetical protein|nr:hypothetical protein [Candidatus Moranbacteria bacterium]
MDKHYLRIQFQNKIFKKNGTECQSFLWEIMRLIYPGFEPVKPYGNIGDKKNDGFIKDTGVYFQIYAPADPSEKQAEAAEKMADDFEGLYKHWDKKYPIKEYNFVFNDKFQELSEPMFSKLAELNEKYPEIKFDILTPKKIENAVLGLSQDQLLGLEFSVDSRDSIKIINDFINNLEIELDKGNGDFVLNSLEKLESSLDNIDNAELKLEYEILKCRALILDGKIPEVVKKYTELNKIYPNDSRPLLYLAEICLDLDDSDKNKSLLDEAEKIDDKSSLLKLEKLIRALRLGESVNLSNIDENNFPQDKRMRSVFYRVYAILYDKEGNDKKADEFIEKAINLNPNRFSNYEVKANILERKKATKKTEQAKKEYYDHLDFLAKKYEEFNNTSKKIRLTLNFRFFIKALGENDPKSANRLAKEIFDQALQLHFDTTVDQILGSLLENVFPPDLDFQKLLSHLESLTIKISDQLAKSLILQFCANGKLLVEGKAFFERMDDVSAVQFIEKISLDKQDELIEYLKKDNIFMFLFASHAKDFPTLRKRTIEELPEAEFYDKNKILLAFHYDQNEIDDAYKILLNINLSESNPVECDLFYKIADQKKDYFLKSKILEKWIQIEKDENGIINLQLSLVDTYFYMKKYPDIVKLGKELLKNKEMINEHNTEVVIRFIILSLMNRGEYPEANKFITEMQEQLNTPVLKFLEADIFTKNSKGKEALRSLVEGVKMQKTPSDEDYSMLYMLMVSIDNLEKIDIETSENEVTENNFVKLTSGSDRWYYIGENLPLDATKVSKDNPKYVSFMNKKVGESIEFPDDKYSPPEKPRSISKILKIENYIFRQIVDKFNMLVHENRIEGVQIIKVAKNDGNFDPKNLINFMKDQSRGKESFFEMYCKNPFPLAFLALNEGGLMNAIGRISSEDRGFIKCMTGTQEEIGRQKESVKLALEGKVVFLDATSALFLAERGLFEKVFKSIPNLKTPYSVINFLVEASKKFELSPGQVGHMDYKKGKIQYHEAHPPTMNIIRNNILNAIKIIEENSNNILYVPESLVSDCFSEKNIPAELRDACILAQENKDLILTDDFLYLQANNLETKKGIPKYFSSITIVKKLFEKGSLSLEEYLDYFYYLSSYRVHFLPLTTDDLEKAVILNRGGVIAIKPENLKFLNLRLILSKNYEVDPQTALRVVISFLIRIIRNNNVSVRDTTDIFEIINSEFLNTYPLFSNVAVQICEKFINNYLRPLGAPINQNEKDKIEAIKDKLKELGTSV